MTSEETIIPFLEELEVQRQRDEFKVIGYVIMPDHIHLVIYPPKDLAVGSVIGEIKKRSSFRILSQWKEQRNGILSKIMVSGRGRQKYAFWQPRGYDHNCRTADITR